MVDPEDTEGWERYTPEPSSKVFWTWFGVGSVAFLMLVAGATAYVFGDGNKPKDPAASSTYSPTPTDSESWSEELPSESPSATSEPSVGSPSPPSTPHLPSIKPSPRKSAKKPPKPTPTVTKTVKDPIVPTYEDCKDVWNKNDGPIKATTLGWSTKLGEPDENGLYCAEDPR